MSRTRLARLWVMVFIQYFVFGAWYVTMGTYLTETLGLSGGQVGLAYGTPALGAMIAPFFVGMVADRFFATERIMAVLHLLGAVLLYAVSQLTTFTTIYPVLIVYASAFMATLALTNSLTLHQLDDPDRQFPLVMSMGSVGWIAAGILIGQLGVEKSATQFQIAALAAAVMAVYSLTLPHTPPPLAGARVTVGGILGVDALRLLKERSFAIFVLGSFLLCIPLSFYFSWTNVFLNEIGIDKPATKMTLGQVSDVTFLLLMPFLVGRLGVKRMLLLGMLAWSVRFLLFAAFVEGAPVPALLYAGILLHGICYDFFFVMGRIYVDRRAPPEIRGTAQGLIAFVTMGAGMFLGTWLSGVVAQHFAMQSATAAPTHRWGPIWLTPAVMAAIVLALFAALFHDDTKPREAAAEQLLPGGLELPA
jgi:nucleoside transporter